jgi:hypothetical protein
MTPPVTRPAPGQSAPGGHPDRQVHEEDPVPARVLHEQSADDQPGGRAHGPGEGERADRPALVGRAVEQPDDHAEGDGGRHRRPCPLDEPGRDQHPRAGREAARERGGDEDRDPGEEHPLPAKQVTQPAAEQQQAAESDQVGGHHPAQAVRGEAEVRLDRGQRDGHDRAI